MNLSYVELVNTHIKNPDAKIFMSSKGAYTSKLWLGFKKNGWKMSSKGQIVRVHNESGEVVFSELHKVNALRRLAELYT